MLLKMVIAVFSVIGVGLQPVAYADLADFSWSFVEQPAANALLHPGQGVLASLPVTLTLRGQALAHGDSLYLSELADCVGEPAYCDEAYGIRLGDSPAAGRKKAFTKKQIAKIVSEEWPGKQWQLEGPERISVRAEEMIYRADEIEAALAAVLNTGDQGEEFRYTIHSLRLSSPLKLRPGSYEMIFEGWQEDVERGYEWIQQKYKIMRPLQLSLRPQEHERLAVVKASILVKIDVVARVLIAKRSLRAHEAINGDAVVADWRPIGGPLRAYARQLHDTLGLITQGPIAAGQTITRQLLAAPLLVQRGQRLSLEVSRGAMVVTSLVRALQGGRQGEAIDVVYDETKTRLRAQIVDAHTVALIQPALTP